MKVTITDNAGTSGTVTVDHADVAEAITPWYPEAPEEVTDGIADLQNALNRREWYIVDSLAAFLAIDIDWTD